MLDNCMVLNINWPEFTAGRDEDSFIFMLPSVFMLCLHTGLHQLTVK